MVLLVNSFDLWLLTMIKYEQIPSGTVCNHIWCIWRIINIRCRQHETYSSVPVIVPIQLTIAWCTIRKAIIVSIQLYMPSLSELLASHSELALLLSSIFQIFEEIAFHMPNSASKPEACNLYQSPHHCTRSTDVSMPKERGKRKAIYSCKQLLVVNQNKRHALKRQLLDSILWETHIRLPISNNNTASKQYTFRPAASYASSREESSETGQ